MPVYILTDSVCSPTGAIRYAINIKRWATTVSCCLPFLFSVGVGSLAGGGRTDMYKP